MTERIGIAIELGARKVFATAVDWPGWSRSGKTEAMALEAMAAAAGRYVAVAALSGESLRIPGLADLEVIERNPGGAGTDFGVPSVVTDHDRRPTSQAEADRLRLLVGAAWAVFDRVAAGAPAELRRGPRGGGRDRDRIVDHVLESDHAYCQVMGIRVVAPSRGDPASIETMRHAVLAALGVASDGSPIGGRKWPLRYAANRIAWHALDHAWEIDDRTELP